MTKAAGPVKMTMEATPQSAAKRANAVLPRMVGAPDTLACHPRVAFLLATPSPAAVGVGGETALESGVSCTAGGRAALTALLVTRRLGEGERLTALLRDFAALAGCRGAAMVATGGSQDRKFVRVE